MRFWDSSALVPLVVGQAASPIADAWFAADPSPAVWTLTPVELSSAIQRLLRDGVIGEEEADEAERRADDLIRASNLVVDVEAAKRQAQRLLRLHPLRAADALQLAAALEWSGGRAAERILHTLDTRLGTAARREGFTVPPAS
jgi:predicted nucleic acid-binding protein